MLSLIALAAVAAAYACSGGSDSTPNTLADRPVRPDAASPIMVAANAPVVIGVSAPLTGSEAPAGIEDRDAVVTAVGEWLRANGGSFNGHSVQVRAEDDGCVESDIAVQAAERLLRTAGLVGVIGPDCSAGAKDALPLYAGAGITAISGTATTPELTASQPSGEGYFFRTVFNDALQGAFQGLFVAQALGVQTAVIIDDGEVYGVALADAAQEGLEVRGVEVRRETIQRGAVDFSTLATSIAEGNPDFVGFDGFNPEAALFYRQLRDAGYRGLFGGGDAAASVATFILPVGESLAEGVYFTGCPVKLADGFVADFTRVHGSAPDSSAFVAHVADATHVLLHAALAVAVRQPDGSLTIDPVKLRDQVRVTALTDGLSGPVAFDQSGDRASGAFELGLRARDLGLTACQVQDGDLVIGFP